MKFNELKSGDFLYFRYDSTTGAYFYIDKIIDQQVFYFDIRVMHRKQEFVYGYEITNDSLWNDRDFMFSRVEECDENIRVLIEYIFEYKYRDK